MLRFIMQDWTDIPRIVPSFPKAIQNALGAKQTEPQGCELGVDQTISVVISHEHNSNSSSLELTPAQATAVHFLPTVCPPCSFPRILDSLSLYLLTVLESLCISKQLVQTQHDWPPAPDGLVTCRVGVFSSDGRACFNNGLDVSWCLCSQVWEPEAGSKVDSLHNW